MKASSILICGNPTLDELVSNERTSVKPGGTALFASCASAYLGSRVGILGNIGADYPRAILRRLNAMDIDLGLLSLMTGPTTRFRITHFSGSRRLRLVEPGSKVRLPEGLRRFKAIHLGPVFNEISSSLIRTVRKRCEFLSVDVQGFVRTVADDQDVRTVSRDLKRLLINCDMVQASIDEARSQTAVRDPIEVLTRFLGLNVQYAIITLGSRGSLLGSQQSGFYFVPAFPEPSIRDLTGAGDVFAGSWVSTYLSTGDPVWASAVGSAFASLSSRKTGLSKFKVARSELFRRAGWVYHHTEERDLVAN